MTVTNATLHNQDEVDRKDVRVGDTVVVRWDSGSVQGRVHALPLDDLSGISHSSYTQGRD